MTISLRWENVNLSNKSTKEKKNKASLLVAKFFDITIVSANQVTISAK